MVSPTHRVWVDLQDHLGILVDPHTRFRLRNHPLIELYRLGIYQVWIDILETVLYCRLRP